MDLIEDKEIIEKILAGDDTAYAQLVRKYQTRVLQLCTTLLADYKEAEDAAQEIFVKAFYALNRFKGNASFYTWLYRISSNHCLDILRKKSRQKTESWESLLEEKGDEIEKLFSQDNSESERNQELVHLILSFLPPDYRMILTLREMQGLNYEEIAASLHCSIDAVKGRLKRARQEFREKLRHFSKSGTV